VGDAPPAEQSPTPLEAVASVGEQVGGPLARPAGCALRTWYAHRVEQFLKLGAAVALTGSHDHRERATFAVTGEVDLGRKASPAASQSLVFGDLGAPFCVCRARLTPGARGVLVGPDHRVVHAELPLHLSHRIVLGLGVGE
jgi:hypothetical protein